MFRGVQDPAKIGIVQSVLFEVRFEPFHFVPFLFLFSFPRVPVQYKIKLIVRRDVHRVTVPEENHRQGFAMFTLLAGFK